MNKFLEIFEQVKGGGLSSFRVCFVLFWVCFCVLMIYLSIKYGKLPDLSPAWVTLLSGLLAGSLGKGLIEAKTGSE